MRNGLSLYLMCIVPHPHHFVNAHMPVPIYQRPIANAHCPLSVCQCPFAIATCISLSAIAHWPVLNCQCPFMNSISKWSKAYGHRQKGIDKQVLTKMGIRKWVLALDHWQMGIGQGYQHMGYGIRLLFTPPVSKCMHIFSRQHPNQK